MPDITDLTLARLERETYNHNASVSDILRLALKDANGGETSGSTKAIILVFHEDEKTTQIVSYRCGMNRAEELGYMDAAKWESWTKWMRE